MHTKVKHLAHIITAVCKLYPVSVHCKHCGTSVGVRRDLMMHTRVKHCTTLVHCKHCTFYHISTLQTLWNQCESQVGSGDAHKSETLYHIITLQTLWNQCERQEGSGDAQKRRTSGSYLMLMHPRPVAYRNLHNAQTMHNL